ncbi:MerR family transcriptional regulator [Staphylococcus chromogenes]|uniref:MerR family transcriptional regulator n=1 Tax=Staphylococcus chromogenes TaxID=46126 RepID=UPI00288602F0|nr:MerR family transcriptional regulator [Staphylococcus chromogenes]MDT0716112.1 MerR family transcriptional regulator [Staphylococcus chromogenes]MDT0736363.1 MerR family transcriptional regulator [Staphylococcus chromogenes]MDT0750433.1 MerR family transcriptional regulator [Staphylococcus chromogenes]
MKYYTTGELAKSYGISTRTLQYYDEKQILKPATHKDSQYRAYTEVEAQKLKAILILKKLGFKLKDIRKIVGETQALNTVKLLLDDNIAQFEKELHQKEAQLKEMKAMNKMIHHDSHSPLTTLNDIDRILKSNRDVPFLTYKTLAIASVTTVMELFAHYQSVKRKKIWPSVTGVSGSLLAAAYITQNYYRHVRYMCPQCHHVFQPPFKEWLFASHTPRTRKLCCPNCHFEGYCVEVACDEISEEKERDTSITK